jgi:hypothetical protein
MPHETPSYIVGRSDIPLTPRERKRLFFFHDACYVMLLAYMGILLINTIAVVLFCVLVAFAKLNPSYMDWHYLASWAGGTTGLLGVGSLVFKSVLEYLFGTGGGRPRITTEAATSTQHTPSQKS